MCEYAVTEEGYRAFAEQNPLFAMGHCAVYGAKVDDGAVQFTKNGKHVHSIPTDVFMKLLRGIMDQHKAEKHRRDDTAAQAKQMSDYYQEMIYG